MRPCRAGEWRQVGWLHVEHGMPPDALSPVLMASSNGGLL